MLSSSLRTNHDKKKIGEGEGEKEHVCFPCIHVPPGGRWLLGIVLLFDKCLVVIVVILVIVAGWFGCYCVEF